MNPLNTPIVPFQGYKPTPYSQGASQKSTKTEVFAKEHLPKENEKHSIKKLALRATKKISPRTNQEKAESLYSSSLASSTKINSPRMNLPIEERAEKINLLSEAIPKLNSNSSSQLNDLSAVHRGLSLSTSSSALNSMVKSQIDKVANKTHLNSSHDYTAFVKEMFSGTEKGDQVSHSFLNTYRYFDTSEEMLQQIKMQMIHLETVNEQVQLLQFCTAWAGNEEYHEGDLKNNTDVLQEIIDHANSLGLERETTKLQALVQNSNSNKIEDKKINAVKQTHVDELIAEAVKYKGGSKFSQSLHKGAYNKRLDLIVKEINIETQALLNEVKNSDLMLAAKTKRSENSPLTDISKISSEFPLYLLSKIMEPGDPANEASGKNDADRRGLYLVGLDLAKKLHQSGNYEAANNFTNAMDNANIIILNRQKKYTMTGVESNRKIIREVFDPGNRQAKYKQEALKHRNDPSFIPIISLELSELITLHESIQKDLAEGERLTSKSVNSLNEKMNVVKSNKKPLIQSQTNFVTYVKNLKFDDSEETLDNHLKIIQERAT